MDRMRGVVRPYAWGSTTAIPELLGTQPTGEPQAELWLGAHPAGASSVGEQSLDALVAAEPERYLGAAALATFGPRLPFLMKVLAAAKPLSLQAHPSRPQAEAGFAREEAAAVALDSPKRIYSDDWPKPELICALEDFEALCGFRQPAATYELFAALGVPTALNLVEPLRSGGAAELERVFTAILGMDRGDRLVDDVVAAARRGGFAPAGETFARTAVELADHFPGDPGVLAALLMNRVRLRRDEAIFLPAGNLHAYLRGTGIEVMANSDNVLRGGLTSKHVAVDELLSILDFDPVTPEPVVGNEEAPGVWRYRTPAPEFALWRIEIDDQFVRVPGDGGGRVLLVTAGSVEARRVARPDAPPAADDPAALDLSRGQAVFVTADEVVDLSGDATVFVSGPGL